MYSSFGMVVGYLNSVGLGPGGSNRFETNPNLATAFLLSLVHDDSDGYSFNIWAPQLVPGFRERYGDPTDVYRWIDEGIHPPSGTTPVPSMISVRGTKHHNLEDCDLSYSSCFSHEVVVSGIEMASGSVKTVYVQDPNSADNRVGHNVVVNKDDWPAWTTDITGMLNGKAEYATLNPHGGSADYPPPNPVTLTIDGSHAPTRTSPSS